MKPPLAASFVADDQIAAVTATMNTILTSATTVAPLIVGVAFATIGPTGFALAQLALCALRFSLLPSLNGPGQLRPTSATEAHVSLSQLRRSRTGIASRTACAIHCRLNKVKGQPGRSPWSPSSYTNDLCVNLSAPGRRVLG